MKKREKLIVAHCPQSNISSSGGIAPVKRYLAEGIRMGLGSDMAGSNTLSLLRAITDAIHVSKARWAFTERGNEDVYKRQDHQRRSVRFGRDDGDIGAEMCIRDRFQNVAAGTG